jgi:hypothetical protein
VGGMSEFSKSAGLPVSLKLSDYLAGGHKPTVHFTISAFDLGVC